MYRVIVFAAVSALALLPLCGQELIYAPGKTMGLENVPPPERNRWKARIVRPVDYDRKEVTECREADFFTLEYGAPLSPFTLELDAKGEASQLWGERADEHTGQAIRFGRGWSGYNYARTQVRAEIVQAGEGEIDWSLVFHTRTGKKPLLSFKTKQGKNDICEHLSMIRLDRVLQDGGLELVAKGPAGARAEVKDLRILPGSEKQGRLAAADLSLSGNGRSALARIVLYASSFADGTENIICKCVFAPTAEAADALAQTVRDMGAARIVQTSS